MIHREPRSLSKICFCGLAGLIVGLATSEALAAPSRPITTASLLEDMVDLAAMAEFPSPAYTCKQFSSYDPASKSPQENWFANADAGHFLRVEDREGRKEHVMMDTAGPGAVVRIWSANPTGTIRIYLDGADQPVIQAPMTDLLGGRFPGLPKPISGEYSRGWNLYFPIPYAKGCKITSDVAGFYYHVNYRTYEPGTEVKTFKLEEIQALRAPLDKLVASLSDPLGKADELGGQGETFQAELPPGGTARQEFAGPKAFTRAIVRVAAADREAALRGLILKVKFDGEECVESPLGDFFGSAPGINPFATLPLAMTKDGAMYCHWYMPFKESAVIEIVNLGKQAVTLSGNIALQDHAWTDRSMHFHAKWRAQSDVPTRPMIDWNYLTVKGKGVFAGVAFAIDNPVKDWWGEGDEKIYVDGESFPSHFGTGTEDYYGYAWGWPELFTHAYHAQPRCDGPGTYGRTSLNRFHILDRIPFTKDFRFDMELWHWHAQCKVNMAVTAYWYARPSATDGFRPIREEDAVVRPLAPYTPPRVAGAVEGESLKILKVTGTAEPQGWASASNEQHLWWHAGMKPGDRLVVAFAAPKAGKYRVMGRFLRARDYGIHQIAINDEKTGAPIDFYHPDVELKEIDFGVHELKQGDNEFSVSVVGANEKAIKAYMFGLDYLLLKPD